MKRLIMVLAAVIVVITPAKAVQQSVFSGSCTWPFAVETWWTVIEYDVHGLPVRASGVCCDGSVWSRELLPPGQGPGTTVDARLHRSDEAIVSVSANEVVDLRIVDLRTGSFTGPEYHYWPDGELDINISALPTGVYGVAVMQNETIITLLTFAK